MGATKKFLIIAGIIFGIGFLIAPALRLLHVPTDTSELLLAVNWISGGFCFVVLGKLKNEF
jgi:hypothetical protein